MNAELLGNVGVWKRPNKDKSITYNLRWYELHGETRRARTLRLGRTEAKPTATSLKVWDRKARLKAAKIQEHLEDPAAAPTRVFKVLLIDAVDNYCIAIEGTKAMSTVDRRQRVAKEWFLYMVEHHPHVAHTRSVIPQHMQGWKLWRLQNIRESTFNVELTDLRDFWTFALEHGYCASHPMTARNCPVKAAQVERAARPIILPDERVIEIVTWKDDPTYRAAMFCLAGTGLRQGELRTLPFNACNGNLLIVPTGERETTKRHGRTIPIGTHLQKLIGEMPFSGPLLFHNGGRPLTSQISGWMKPFGHTPHDLRRWFYTKLEALECPDGLKGDIVGHVAKGQRGAYAGIDVERARPYLEKIDSLLSTQLALQTV